MKSRVGFYWPQTLPLLVLLLVISRVSADVSTTTEIPKRTTESYLMGVSLFEGIRLSAENEYLTRSLPMILLASLKKLEARVISDREADGIRASIIRSALDAEYAKVSDALRTLDKGFFDAIADATKKKTEEDLQGRRDRIAFLRGMDRERIAVGERYPIVFIKKNLEGELLDLPIPEPEAFARANKLDLLVYGTVEEIAGYLYISIFLWNAAIGQPMPLFQAGGTSRGVQANLMASMNRIEAVVRGEKTGYLTVRTGEEDAVIEIDGQVIGVGRVNQFPLPAGVKLLSVSGASLVAVSQSCEIVEGRETMVELAVERRIVRYVPITTFPRAPTCTRGGGGSERPPSSIPIRAV